MPDNDRTVAESTGRVPNDAPVVGLDYGTPLCDLGQAARVNDLAEQRGEAWLPLYGGVIHRPRAVCRERAGGTAHGDEGAVSLVPNTEPAAAGVHGAPV